MFSEFVLYFPVSVQEKLRVFHGVTQLEVEEAFYNSLPPYLYDTRAKHDKKSQYFIAPTAKGRLLKVCFIANFELLAITILTAFEPDERDIKHFLLKGGRL